MAFTSVSALFCPIMTESYAHTILGETNTAMDKNRQITGMIIDTFFISSSFQCAYIAIFTEGNWRVES